MSEPADKKRSRSRVPRVEVLLVLVFLLSVIMWSIARCSRQRRQPKEKEAAAAVADTLVQTDSAGTSGPAQAPPQTRVVERTRLYVTINNLKLRSGPSLKHEVITTLPLYEEVWFLDEVTQKRDTINLGYETAIEPWVKVRTRKGKEGWVFGAGVDFYKYKRSGVLE